MLKRAVLALLIVLVALLQSQGINARFASFQVNGAPNAIIVITGGQSNDVGATDQSVLPAHLQTVDPMVKVWTASGFVTLQNGVNGSNLDFPTAGFPANPPQNWGPEAEWIYQYRLAHPGTTVYLVKSSYGGIPLCACIGDGQGGTENWDPATVSSYFARMEGFVAAARAAIPAGIPVAALLWMQGEQDASFTVSANAYAVNIAAFNAAVATRWGAPRCIAIGRITTNWVASAAVRTAQVAAASPPSIVWINTDAFPLQPDNVHYNATGQVDLGGAMYTGCSTGANVP